MTFNPATEQLSDNREKTDRRKTNLKTFLYATYKGTRESARREEEATSPFYTDLYEKKAGLMILLIACLSTLDSFLTLIILGHGGEEANPLMAYLLDFGNNIFLSGKYLITVSCLIFALVHINFKVLFFFPMRKVLAALLVFYSCLISYEVYLLVFIIK